MSFDCFSLEVSKRRSKHKDKLSRTTEFFELCLYISKTDKTVK